MGLWDVRLVASRRHHSVWHVAMTHTRLDDPEAFSMLTQAGVQKTAVWVAWPGCSAVGTEGQTAHKSHCWQQENGF